MATAIKVLEERQLSLHEAIVIVEVVKDRLLQSPDVDEEIKAKVITVLTNNAGYQDIREIDRRLEAEDFEDLPEGWTREMLEDFRYASIVSIETERTFSSLKNIFRDNRRSFTFEKYRTDISNFYPKQIVRHARVER